MNLARPHEHYLMFLIQLNKHKNLFAAFRPENLIPEKTKCPIFFYSDKGWYSLP
jgi:hypothetical protein